MPFPVLNITALPLRTDRTLRAVPYVTYTLLFLNLCIFIFNLRLSDYEFFQFSTHWGFTISQPSLITLFTYVFLHEDIFHLLGNMLMLWLVGTVLETGIGSITFLLLYFASSVTAIIINGLIGRAFLPDSLTMPLIGASGAIAGLTGFAAIRFYRLRVLTFPLVGFIGLPLPIPLPIPIWLPLWAYAVYFAGRELYAGLSTVLVHRSGSVGHWAHIGGLLLGVLVAALLRVLQEGKRESVLEDTMRAATGATPQAQPRREVQRLLRESPDDPEMLEAMAALTLVNGEHERSREFYTKAIPLFFSSGNRERAATCYMNILRIDPESVLPEHQQMSVATTLEAMKHFPEAVQAFLLMADRYPRLEEAQTALLRAAHIYHRYLQDPTESQRILTNLLTMYPDSPWSNLAHERLATLNEALRSLPFIDQQTSPPAPPLEREGGK